MAGPYHGKRGRVSVGGTALTSLTAWDLTTSIDVADTTAMSAVNDWETQETGLSDFSGTAEGLSSEALDTVALVGSTAATKFHLDVENDNGEFEGNAIITSLTETVNTEDVGKLSYSFEGDDAQGLAFAAGATSATAVLATAFHGKNARVLWNSIPIFKPKEWTATVVSDTADSTAMSGSNNGRTRLPGFKAGTATFSAQISTGGFADSAGTAIALGDSQVLQLWRTGDISKGAYSGTAEITGRDVTVDSRGVEMANYTVKFDGAVSIATS